MLSNHTPSPATPKQGQPSRSGDSPSSCWIRLEVGDAAVDDLIGIDGRDQHVMDEGLVARRDLRGRDVLLVVELGIEEKAAVLVEFGEDAALGLGRELGRREHPARREPRQGRDFQIVARRALGAAGLDPGQDGLDRLVVEDR